jgi:hypothetical protein
MNIQQCIEWIKQSNQQTFRIKFIKRTDGQIREMNCQYGVTRELTVVSNKRRI